MKFAIPGAILLVVVIFVTAIAFTVRSHSSSQDKFEVFDRECRDKGGQPLWTGNDFKNQIICLKKDVVIEEE